MKEVIQKAADLVEALENKIAETEAAKKKLLDRKAYWDSTEKRQQAADNQLSARERILGKFEDTEKAKADLKKASKKVAADKVSNNLKAADLKKGQEALDKDKKDLEVMKAVYAKKNANMDAREIEYDAKFKLMKKKVLEELTGKL